MNRKLKRAELATRVKALFATSDPSQELAFLGQVIKDVYLKQKEEVRMAQQDSGLRSVQSIGKATSK